jgi:hypothetical protein
VSAFASSKFSIFVHDRYARPYAPLAARCSFGPNNLVLAKRADCRQRNAQLARDLAG